MSKDLHQRDATLGHTLELASISDIVNLVESVRLS